MSEEILVIQLLLPVIKNYIRHIHCQTKLLFKVSPIKLLVLVVCIVINCETMVILNISFYDRLIAEI